jgi:hypothetical protein
MRLVSIRLKNVGPFDDTTLRLVDAAVPDADDVPETIAPRPVTVLFGGDGTGKTTLLSALALTRPGYALPPLPHGPREGQPHAEPAYVVCEWLLGEDDPERPHPLVVTSPTAVLDGEPPEIAAVRRREQTLFDRRAQHDGGFVFVSFSGARWFSRAANTLSVPERSILRYDVRAPSSFDDPTRADLTRETKQVLSYAAISRAVAGGRAEYVHLARFDAALREVVDVMLEPFGFSYAGVSPTSLEPEARDMRHGASRVVPFDALPRPARHLVAFGVLTLRALFAAYPGAEDPREREGVVAIDDVESQQDPAILRSLVALLRRALPNVQWVLTTSSTQLAMACSASEVVALRRTGGGSGSAVEIGEGVLH